MSGCDLETIPNVLKKLALLLGTEIAGRRLTIPEKYGHGYCVGYVFNEHIRLMISSYELKEDIAINNPEFGKLNRMIFFKFQNVFSRTDISHQREIPSVLIATSRMYSDEVIAIHTNAATINIEVDADYLRGLFNLSGDSTLLQRLLQNTQPLLFEQVVYPSLQRIVDEIVTEDVDERFELFFRRIKSEELVCRLLMELEKREENHLYSLNQNDIQAIYMVKAQMLLRLDKPPVIEELAAIASMSTSKLKRLFKQIFGSSIFSYYQKFRINEAARMLKEDGLSVSDVGYKLGFTNLSHFSRVFNQQIGMNPKRFSCL